MAKAPLKPTAKQKQLASKPFFGRTLVIVTIISIVIGGLIASFTYYHSQQKEIWEGRLNQSKEQSEERQRQIDILNKELAKVKQDLNEYVEKEKKSSTESSTGKKVTEISDKAFEFTLMKSKLTNVLSNMSMEITGLDFKQNPDRYTVKARVYYEGSKPMTFGDAEVGYKVTYPEIGGVDIEVLKVTPVSATFSIMKSQTQSPK